MASTKTASAIWRGDLKSGRGESSTQSGVLDGQSYSFKTRFGDAKGTNPEELLAAAHAQCFAMALANGLSEKGHTPNAVHADVGITLGTVEGAPTITKAAITVKVECPGLDKATFQQVAEDTKTGCPVSKALASIPEITLDASLGG